MLRIRFCKSVIFPIVLTFDYFTNLQIISLKINSCPQYTEELSKEIPSSNLGRVLAKDKVAIDKLALLLNTTFEAPLDLAMTVDGIRIHIQLEEIKRDVPQEMVELYNHTFKNYLGLFFEVSGAKSEMLRYRIGVLLSEVVKNFQLLANGEKTARKFLIYSGHDINIYSLAMALGVRDQIPDPVYYGDTLMFDLISGDSDQEPLVQVDYLTIRNDVGYLKYPLQIIEQRDNCSLSDFVDLVSHLLTTEKELYEYCRS